MEQQSILTFILDDTPWLASIRATIGNQSDVHICFGAIISSYRVITAAHCLNRQDSNITHVCAYIHMNLQTSLMGFYALDCRRKWATKKNDCVHKCA